MLMHRFVPSSGDVLQTVVGEDPDAGRLLQHDGRVAQDQVVNGVRLLAEDSDGG